MNFKSLLSKALLLSVLAQSLFVSSASAAGPAVTITSKGPAASDLPIGGTEIPVLGFTISTTQDITFDSFAFSLDMSSDRGNIEAGLLNSQGAALSNVDDIKLVDVTTGFTLVGPLDAEDLTSILGGKRTITEKKDDAKAYGIFTDDFSMQAGDTLNVALMVDIAYNRSLDGSNLTAALELGTSYPVIEDSANNVLDNNLELYPTVPLVGSLMTLKASSLEVTLNSSVVSASVPGGTTGVPFLALDFSCGDISFCKVTDLSLQGLLDDNGGGDSFSVSQTGADHGTYLDDYVSNFWLMDSNGLILAGPENVSSAFKLNFNTSFSVAPSNSMTIYLVGDLHTAYLDNDSENIAFALLSGSQITVEDQNGNAFPAKGSVNLKPLVYVTTVQ